MKASSLAIASLLSLCPSLLAQGTTAQLLDGRILTPVDPHIEWLTEGPITALTPGSQSFQAQGLTVTIPATVDGVPFEILGTNHNGAPVTAATLHALLDENASPGGRDAGTPMHRGAVRSIFGSGRLQLANTQDAPNALSTRTHMEMIRSQIVASHAVPVLASESIVVPGQADLVRPNRFEYTGATLKSAGQVYEDAQGNRFLIPDAEMGIEFAENLVSGPVTSVSVTGDYPSFVVGEMPVVLNPDPRFPVSIVGIGGTPLSAQTFFQQLAAAPLNSVAHLIAEGYVVDGVLFAIHIESEFLDPLLLPQVTIDRAQFDNARNEVRLQGIVDRPVGLRVRIELLNGAGATAATFVAPILVNPLLGGAGNWSLRQRGGIAGGLAAVQSVRLSLIDAANVVVNSRDYLRSQL